MNQSAFHRPYAFDTAAEGSTVSLAHALRCGKPFGRRLTRQERLVLALVAAQPTQHLTLTSADLSRCEIAKAWRLFRQRVERERQTPDKLIFVAFPARAVDGAGYHLHCLVWSYLHYPMLVGHAKGSGFGSHVSIKQIEPKALSMVSVASYAVGQRFAVFGTKHHRKNVALERNERPFFRPHDATLARHNPRLLHALHAANDPAVSDERLLQRCPSFNSYIPQRNLTGTTGDSAEQEVVLHG